ncbi:MAG: ankyrin repeat domain-containing protein [Alphaproteobacteria bacterium]|nr:MAG: ankyrin repeat domain-containing protein [Alphaproteobacteria bacterium]
MKKRPVPAKFVVDRRDSLGVTLLMEAARRGVRERMLQCLDEGSDINAVDNGGYNALMHALQGKQDVPAIDLINRGIDVTLRAKNGSTALIEACQSQMPEIIERLLKKKVPLDAQNSQGNTALMIACLLNDGWAACRVAEEGADFETLKNKKEMTAIDIARRFMDRKDLVLFENIIEKRREEKKLADIRAAETKAQELEQNVQDATVLQREIKVGKPVALKLKPR